MEKNTDIEESNEALDLLKKQCTKVSKYTDTVLIQLLNKNNLDIAECVFNIEDNLVEEVIKRETEVINWDEKLRESNYDQRIIRKILDEKDKLFKTSK